MAVSSSTNKATFTQAGTTTEFSLEVKCPSTDAVQVYTKIDGVQAEVTTGITKAAVSGDLDNGVTVTFDTAPAIGTVIILIRDVDETQILELSEGGNLSATGLEDALDRGVMISQQITERFDRSIQFPVSDPDGTTYDVGTTEKRANKALGFDASGNVTELDLADPAYGVIGVDTAKGLVLASNVISGKVDDTTLEFSGGNIAVKAGGIGATQLASDAVTTAKIADANITKAKIENVANMRVLGNVSGSAAAPAEVAVLDEDTMASDSATSLATQQSIKAYVDAASIPVFTDWTPTIVQGTATNIGKTVNYAKYTRIGNLVTAWLDCVITGTGGSSVKIVVSGFPTIKSGASCIGVARIANTGSSVYVANVIVESTSSVVFWGYNVASPIGNSPSFTLGNTDIISFIATYETE